MKPISLHFLKTFLLTGLGFGLLMGLIDLIFDGSVDLWESLYRLFYFGTIMTLVFGLSHIYVLKRMGVTSFTTENLAVKQKRLVLSNLSVKDFLNKLKSDHNLKKMEATEEGNRILLSSNITWMGGGKKVTASTNIRYDNRIRNHEPTETWHHVI